MNKQDKMDDGRVIAPMNFERRRSVFRGNSTPKATQSNWNYKDKIAMVSGAITAGLVFAGVVGIIYYLVFGLTEIFWLG